MPKSEFTKPNYGYTLPRMSMLEEVVQHLQANKGKWSAIARRSRVPKRTLEKIAMRVTKDPRFKTVEKLSAVCRTAPNEQRRSRHRTT